MTTQPQTAAGARLLLRVVGAGLLIASAAVHLDLYVTGYRTIPTIGWLFLLQVIVGFVLGLAILATGSRLVAAVGALFALSTLGGYLLTVQFGLFGFREVRTTAGIVAGLLEVLAFAALAVLAATTGPSARRRAAAAHQRSPAERNPWVGRASDGVSGMQAGLGAAAISVVALGLLAGALAAAGNSASNGGANTNQASSGPLRTEVVHGTTVLANASGRTLYWFAPDKANKSVCYGSCAQYWPPVGGPVTAGPGIHGTLSTIHRTDGSVQETYNGHPLYTYAGDSAPGQANGNKLNLNGGFWYEVVVSG